VRVASLFRDLFIPGNRHRVLHPAHPSEESLFAESYSSDATTSMKQRAVSRRRVSLCRELFIYYDEECKHGFLSLFTVSLFRELFIYSNSLQNT
jgi:hypothetical protein